MLYTIIEDCSPFYIRFTWDGIENLTSLCKGFAYPESNNIGFRHLLTDGEFKNKILDLVPMNKQMPLNQNRVSFFMTEPNFYYGAHKDSINHRFSLNVTVSILDDKCVTSWYSDKDLKEYKISVTQLPSLGLTNGSILNIPAGSREILEWNKTKHIPIKSMIAKPNEAILFNTDIYHDWDNSQSSNRRIVLTLRHATPGFVYFGDARKILFGY